MQLTGAIQKLGRNDAKLIGRDSFLAGMFAYAILIAVAARFGIPWLATQINGVAGLPEGFVFESAYPMVLAFLALFMGAMFAGMIFGFVLLDEKDDNTLKAMLVTPLPMSQYLVYRVGVPLLIAVVLVVAQVYIINLPATLLPLWQMILISVSAALMAPITALFFAVFAANKVQGFAMTKFTGVAGMIILVGWFVAEPAQWLLGFFPPFLVSKAYWLALEGRSMWIGVWALSIVMQALVIWLLARRFTKVAYEV